eukprot:g6148.t1
MLTKRQLQLASQSDYQARAAASQPVALTNACQETPAASQPVALTNAYQETAAAGQPAALTNAYQETAVASQPVALTNAYQETAAASQPVALTNAYQETAAASQPRCQDFEIKFFRSSKIMPRMQTSSNRKSSGAVLFSYTLKHQISEYNLAAGEIDISGRRPAFHKHLSFPSSQLISKVNQCSGHKVWHTSFAITLRKLRMRCHILLRAARYGFVFLKTAE